MFERLTSLISGANIAGATAAPKKTTTDIAREVIAGDWGNGEKRTEALKKAGYNPTEVQEEVNRLLSCRELIIQNIKAWATKTANSHKYKYVRWDDPYGHECAVCHPHNGKNKGWQCIGWTMACWHHGGLPILCNCGVIDNNTAEKILKAKTDAEALKIAQDHLKLKDIKVIRNNKKVIPKDWAQPGDIALLFTDKNVYQHMYLIMSDKYVSDSTQAGGLKKDISATREFKGRYVSGMKILIRYTGNGFTTPPKKTINQLANEVIEGKWGSGTSRKKALTECGYNYDAVQSEVNEILNPTKQEYTGPIPTLRLKKTNTEVIADAIKWAKWIAGDNRFHYGYTNKHGSTNSKDWNPNAHHNGCYFCGTNTTKGGRSKKGIVDYQFTYCCNPFVGAAWAHGGCVPAAINLCQNGKSWNFEKGTGYDTSKLFTNLGHPKKSALKAGDVLCRDNHVAFYIGGGKVAEASGGDDNVRNSKGWNNSIHIRELTDAFYKKFPRVHRFNSSVDADILMRHGEVSKRVAEWQAYLDWYFDGKVGSADGYFGDNTLKWTKEFQEREIGKGQGDGICGNKTFEAAKKVKK